MLLLALSLCLLPQGDPVFGQYNVKIQDKILFFGRDVVELHKFNQDQTFTKVNNNVYGPRVFDVASDRPVVISNKVFVPRIDTMSGTRQAFIDVLEITGDVGRILNSTLIFPLLTDELKIKKFSDDTIICVANSRYFRTLSVFEIGTSLGSRFLRTYQYSELGLESLTVTQIEAVQHYGKEIYVFMHSPDSAILFHVLSGWKHVEEGFLGRDDTIPDTFSFLHKSRFGTEAEWLVIQSGMQTYLRNQSNELREFIPYRNNNFLHPYNYSKIPSNVGFLGEGDGDFDGDGINEAIITGYGDYNNKLTITQVGAFVTYTQEFPLIDEYKFLTDAISGDWNQDLKTDLVIAYMPEWNEVKYKFLRGTNRLFQPSLVWD